MARRKIALIGAGQIVVALRGRDQQDADRLSRLNHDIRPAIGKQFFVLDGGGFQEGGSGELMHVLAVVFKAQLVGLAGVEGEVVGLEAVVDHDDGDRLGMAPRIGGVNGSRQQTQ